MCFTVGRASLPKKKKYFSIVPSSFLFNCISIFDKALLLEQPAPGSSGSREYQNGSCVKDGTVWLSLSDKGMLNDKPTFGMEDG